ncbi:MAG: hypothetical protein H6707_12265 [Deltaproteobacteria bacterium]|nr:hypothetical protein [Deltaproteobacteria bacterium]
MSLCFFACSGPRTTANDGSTQTDSWGSDLGQDTDAARSLDRGVDAQVVALPPGIGLGVYHALSDPKNLSINADYSYHWGSCGCDYTVFGVGTWNYRVGERGIELHALPGMELTWNYVSSGAQRAEGITVTPGTSGGLVIAGTLVDSQGKDPTPFEEQYLPGRLCFSCDGGEPQPCAGPLPVARACGD